MNPSEEAIKLAKETLDAIEVLKQRVDATTIFASQLQMHRDTLEDLRKFLERTDHTISFIGPVGVGKTTVICRLLNLIQDSKPMLDVGTGRTTISEVHVISGNDYGITIDPLSDDEIGRYVDEFSDSLLTIARIDDGDNLQVEGAREMILSTEVERCLRNMCNLQKRSTRFEGQLRIEDRALDLARQLQNRDALRAEILSRMSLSTRNKTEIICDATKEDEKRRWLKKTFSEINHGRHPDFSIPYRITVILPYGLIDHSHYRFTIVDTKGIDQTAQRADIERQIKDDRNLKIFCSSFPDAPHEGIVSIIRGTNESGIGTRLTTETCLLVFPKNDEAVNVNGPDGQPVGEKELGYEMKRGEIVPNLLVYGLRDYAVHFYDDRADSPDNLLQFVNARISVLRGYYERRISEVAQTVKDVEANVENAIARATFRHVISAVQAWIEECRNNVGTVNNVYETLVESIHDRNTHPSSVRASVNRRGHWYNMDFYHQIGFDSRLQTVHSIRELLQKFAAITDNMLRQEELSPAHSFVKELRHYLSTTAERLYNDMHQFGQAIFEAPLDQDADWAAMGREFGRGPGYKGRIVLHTRQWFEAPEQRARLELFRKKLSERWLEIITDLAQKLKGSFT